MFGFILSLIGTIKGGNRVLGIIGMILGGSIALLSIIKIV
jgi:hypothetical protein